MGQTSTVQIVEAAEAVAGHPVRPAGLSPLRGGDAVGPARRARRAGARSSSDVGVVHLHCEGPGPHLAPEMAPPLPAPGPVHRPERARRGQRGPGGLRPGVPLGRAAPVPVRARCRSTPSSSTRRRRTPTGSARSARRSRRCTRRSRAAKTVIVQFNRSMPRTLGESFIHVDEIDLAVEVDVPPYDVTGRRDRRRRAPDRRVRRRPRAGRRHPPARDRGDPDGDGARRSTTSSDLGIHTEMFTDAVVDLVEAGVVTGARKERNRGKIVAAFMMGSQRLYEFVARQPDGRDAVGRLHERHPRHPLVRPDDRDQLGDRGRPDRPGRRRFDRPPAVQRRRRPDGLHPRRGARGARAGRSSPCRRPPAGGTGLRIVADLEAGAGVVTTRAHVRTVVTEWGVAELFGRSIRERAEALIAIAHPDHRDALLFEARRTHAI